MDCVLLSLATFATGFLLAAARPFHWTTYLWLLGICTAGMLVSLLAFSIWRSPLWSDAAGAVTVLLAGMAVEARWTRAK